MARRLLANTVIESFRRARSRGEGRHRRLPRHQPRARHGDRAGALDRPQAAHDLAPRDRPRRARPGRHPRRVLLRRLSALRRHGGAVAGDAARSAPTPRAAATCSACATASRSSPRPGCCRARCCATPRCASCPWTAGCGSSAPTPISPATTSAARSSARRWRMATATTSPTTATLDRLEGEGLVAFRYATPDGRGEPAGQPQRQRPQHRRHLLARTCACSA